MSLLAHLLFILFGLMVFFLFMKVHGQFKCSPSSFMCVVAFQWQKETRHFHHCHHQLFQLNLFTPQFFFPWFFFVHGYLSFQGWIFSWTCFHVCYKVVIAITKPNSQANLSFFKNELACPLIFHFILAHGLLLLFINVHGQLKCF
jgi:hypothetical protein